ncbi:hypothetical protein BC829DRAFT_448710 [Chytridium lagenaria]|nr:hypothetical protein BC829DRAFT_448710 [Chytridium lagenaria]
MSFSVTTTDSNGSSACSPSSTSSNGIDTQGDTSESGCSSFKAMPSDDYETIPFPPHAKIIDISNSLAAKLIPGRGVGLIATSDIPEDTTILIEAPILSWQRGEYDSKILAAKMLRKKAFRELTATLFPKTLEELPEGRKQQFSEAYLSTILDMATSGRTEPTSLSSSPPPPSASSLSLQIFEDEADPDGPPTLWDALADTFFA